ncbi:MAG: hypothetical protein JWM43_3559 [Acidobacteriaceae bacterium]|nr:hypothetical protein [Acidobacteriaceae bacterium]
MGRTKPSSVQPFARREPKVTESFRSKFRIALAAFLALPLAFQAVPASASVALLMEEPYGGFGGANPTGHAAVYLNHICAESPTQLRPCRSGEFGVVISRYHKIDHLDWIAIPLIPYLYAVSDVNNVPKTVDKAQVAALREAYRLQHLEPLAPDQNGKAPKGEWTQLVGSSYDRTIHGFQVISTPQQDERFIALFNDRKNIGHFNLLFHNCADFSRVVLDTYMPHAIHRNFVADLGLMTPKQAAKSLVKYGKKHPELEMNAFIIPQVPGSIGRSHRVDGVTESLTRSKKYLLPLAVLSPEFAGGIVAAYLVEGRMRLPKNAMMFEIDDAEMTGGPKIPIALPGEVTPPTHP